jgi:hypothetical protein
MKTAVAHSSLQTFDAMSGSGFAAFQALILARMKHGQLYSRRQLSAVTKLETSCIAGRVNELIATGAIEVCGSMKCPISGRTVEAIKRPTEQMELLA